MLRISLFFRYTRDLCPRIVRKRPETRTHPWGLGWGWRVTTVGNRKLHRGWIWEKTTGVFWKAGGVKKNIRWCSGVELLIRELFLRFFLWTETLRWKCGIFWEGRFEHFFQFPLWKWITTLQLYWTNNAFNYFDWLLRSLLGIYISQVNFVYVLLLNMFRAVLHTVCGFQTLARTHCQGLVFPIFDVCINSQQRRQAI